MEPRRFDSVEDAAQWIREDNPHLSQSEDALSIVSRYSRLYPGTIEVGRKATIDVMPKRSLASGLFDRSTLLGATAANTMDLFEGAISGATLGGTKGIGKTLHGGDYGNTPFYKTGEWIGEIVGPYNISAKAGAAMEASSPLIKKMMEKSPQLTRILGAGAESGIIEGIKAPSEGRDPLTSTAVGFATGALPQAVWRGGKLGLQKGWEKYLGPSKAEKAEMQSALDIAKKWDLPLVAASLRPYNNLIQYLHFRTTHTAANAKIVANVHKRLATGIQRIQNNVVGKLGENSTVPSAASAGRTVVKNIIDEIDRLKTDTGELYEAIRKSEIGLTPINAKATTKFKFDDGSVTEGSILEDLAKIAGTTSNRSSVGWRKKLAQNYADISKAHVTKDTEELIPGKGRSITEFFSEQPQEYFESGIDPVENFRLTKAIEGNEQNFYVQPKVEIPQYSYDWWYGKLQDVGDLFGKVKASGDRNAIRVVGKYYKTLQNHIDAQASAVDENFATIIKQARAMHVMREEFESNALVKQLLNYSEEGKNITNLERGLDVIFRTPDSIRDAKKILGPDAYSMARQAYVADLLWSSMQRDSKGNISDISVKKLTNRINKEFNGIYGDFWNELFSDGNFVTREGKSYYSDVGGKQLQEKFMEYLEGATLLDRMQEKSTQAQEMLSGFAAERTSAGQLAKMNPSQILTVLKSLVAQIYIYRKGGQVLFPDSDASVLLGGRLTPPGGTKEFGFGPFRANRRSATSSTLNALRNAVSREDEE